MLFCYMPGVLVLLFIFVGNEKFQSENLIKSGILTIILLYNVNVNNVN